MTSHRQGVCYDGASWLLIDTLAFSKDSLDFLTWVLVLPQVAPHSHPRFREKSTLRCMHFVWLANHNALAAAA